MSEEFVSQDIFPNVKELSSAWLDPSIRDTNEFFQRLAESSKKAFDADQVTIWDNNVYGNCLVLLAADPPLMDAPNRFTIPKDTSLTGLTIRKGEITPFKNLHAPDSYGRFYFPVLLPDSLRADIEKVTMISIPVFNTFDTQFVMFVINLFFNRPMHVSDKTRERINEWVIKPHGVSLDYQLLKVDELIRRTVAKVAPAASGIPGLFDGISERIRELALCDNVSLLLWDYKRKRLEPVNTPAAKAFLPDYLDRIIAECIDKLDSTVFKKYVQAKSSSTGALSEWLAEMAAPIISSDGHPLGVLHCSQAADSMVNKSFSSLDVQVLECFARSMAPSVERFLRLRAQTVLKTVIEEVSSATAKFGTLDEVLQCAIEALTKAMRAAVGSIYVLEEKKYETPMLRVRAATGVHKDLMQIKAEYEIGEGITGEIATGNLINFRTLEERRAHPAWKGKYVREREIEKDYAGTPGFLGVPIMRNQKILGVWKIEFLRPTLIHPDPYFTDEDEEMARVLSSFLAFLIENYRIREALTKEFQLLAASSVEIQGALSEDDAILAVMNALENSGWHNALLSLYDPVTKEIVGRIASGRWSGVEKLSQRAVESDHIQAQVLRLNEAIFIQDSRTDERCDPKLVSLAQVIAHYALPLRVGDELIGTLQVDMGKRTAMNEEESLILKAFASYLSVSISRIRSLGQTLALTDQVISSSRFITAETLSSMSIHSLGHRLKNILRELREDLSRPEIKEHRLLLDVFKRWEKQLIAGHEEVVNALQIVKSGGAERHVNPIDFHPQVQQTIDTWFAFLSHHKCAVRINLEAAESRCRFSPNAFREILSVLLVNSVQAFAKEIEIKTINLDSIESPPHNDIQPVFCLEFSDDGLGIPPELGEEIFSASYTTKPEKFGTGLGLFIARNLARRGGGDLFLLGPYHARGRGASFRLVIQAVI